MTDHERVGRRVTHYHARYFVFRKLIIFKINQVNNLAKTLSVQLSFSLSLSTQFLLALYPLYNWLPVLFEPKKQQWRTTPTTPTSWKTKTTKLAPTIIYKTTHYAVFQHSSQLITNGTPGTPTGKPRWINWNFKMNEDGKPY